MAAPGDVMNALNGAHTGLTVAIPAHNPDADRLNRVLAGLRVQSLRNEAWERLLIDNASEPPISKDDSVRIVREHRLGLTWARAQAIREARGRLIVFVDDDNVLDPGYLQVAMDYMDQHPAVSAIGGVIEPEFETTPPAWLAQFLDLLAVRDFGSDTLVSDGSGSYPKFAPVGAGMVIRRKSALRWLDSLSARETALPDRQGADLSSSGDNDMIFCCLEAGEKVAYVPFLRLTHLIPEGRLTPQYLARLNRGIQKSWVQVLHLHGACPWTGIDKWTLPLRKARAYLRYRAWHRPVEWIRWRGACGHFEGRAELD